MPQPTIGFYDKYKLSGGAVTGCTLLPHSSRAGLPWMALLAALVLALGRSPRRREKPCRQPHARRAPAARVHCDRACPAFSLDHQDADWSQSPVSPLPQTPDWGIELGVSLYRPAVDSEFASGVHPYADTFGSSRHLLSEVEVDRYLSHRFGTSGVGLRGGYYKVNGAAFLADGITRSGDETTLPPHPLRAVGPVSSRSDSGPEAGAARPLRKSWVRRRGVDDQQHRRRRIPRPGSPRAGMLPRAWRWASTSSAWAPSIRARWPTPVRCSSNGTTPRSTDWVLTNYCTLVTAHGLPA